MRKDRHLFNSILKKISVGYVLMIAMMCLYLGAGVSMTAYLANHYKKLTNRLTDISHLEDAVEQFSVDIEKAAVYFQKEGITDYSNTKKSLQEQLTSIAGSSDHQYSRSAEDLRATLDTYMEESDALIADIQKYIDQDSYEKTSNPLSNKYRYVSQLRTFVRNCIQDEYAYNLAKMESNQQRIHDMEVRITFALTCLLIAIAATAFWYVNYVYRDIHSSISEFERGITEFQSNVQSATPIQIRSGDEFELLSQAFNDMEKIISGQMAVISENAQMKERLVKAENQNLKMYSDLQKNHLKFLQSRINPHFLFNTLNMIASMAMLEDAEKSAEMMTITATFLRYNLDNVSKQVTLSQEISNLEDYIAIQKCRYGDRFSFEFHVDPETTMQIMPAMILQPMVENSILHGIGMMPSGGTICIGTKLENDKVMLSVKDNGTGMTAAQMDELKERIEKTSDLNSHIGLRNIFQRLQLFYNGKAQIDLIGCNPGLEIQIRVPLNINNVN